MQEDEEPTPEELREAEELARALDRGHGGSSLPEDALGAAALLRYSKNGATLSPERSDAILADAIAGVGRRRKGPRRFFLLSAVGLSMAAALVLFILRSESQRSAPLPAPSEALLTAELDAARPNAENAVALGTEMQPYRESVYAVLEERYRR